MGFGKQYRYSENATYSAREVGEIPAPQHVELVAACERDLRLFATEFFGPACSRWYECQESIVRALQACVLDGGLSGLCLPRGTGKTTLTRIALLWAAIYGHRRFLVVVGASQQSANAALKWWRTHLLSNAKLYEAYPAIVHPFRHTSGLAQRATAQTYSGELTHIAMEVSRLRFATIPGTISTGQQILSKGIESEIRGLSIADPATGETQRPDCALLDDPQSHESANSLTQTASRLEILNGDVLGLAGAEKQIAGLALITTIAPGDLAEQLMDRERAPLWSTTKVPLVKSWSSNPELWEQYRTMVLEDTAAGRGRIRADEFYAENRSAMDAGWEITDRGCPPGVTPEQYVFELLLRDEQSFYAERQLEPAGRNAVGEGLSIRVPDVQASFLEIERRHFPWKPWKIIATCDIGQRICYWNIVGLLEDGSIHLADWGAWPQQTRDAFSSAKPRPAIAPGELRNEMQRMFTWLRDQACFVGGEEIYPTLVAADGGYQVGKVVGALRECRRDKRDRANLLVTIGRVVNPGGKPVHEFESRMIDKKLIVKREGILCDFHKFSVEQRPLVCRRMFRDANMSKTSLARKFHRREGGARITISKPSSFAARDLLVAHLTAEQPVLKKVVGVGSCETWEPVRGSPDNHWLDCLAIARDVGHMLGMADDPRDFLREGDGDRHMAPRPQSLPRPARANGDKPKRTRRQVVSLDPDYPNYPGLGLFRR